MDRKNKLVTFLATEAFRHKSKMMAYQAGYPRSEYFRRIINTMEKDPGLRETVNEAIKDK